MFVSLSLLCTILLFVLTTIDGMPRKRWMAFAALSGPVAVVLYSVHLRRAWMRTLGFGQRRWFA
ncbi:hypothetical protein ACFOEE_01085 [Pseudoalteromonas fenneropenaei]|uniref:Uncharacterized protein n=1 Tax=Pseudoalteromonas fenneropenaei TaxID=1737459 RepID=A0ABV7CCN2_9GAMM